MISKPERLADAPGIRHLQYNYPPVSTSAGIAEMEKQAVIDQTEPAFGPRNLTSAVARSEQLWASNVEKRKAFVESKGGYDAIRMFSDKAWVGYGQMWTLWDIFVPAFTCPWEVERIGVMADGGKYVCGLPRVKQARKDKCVVYSFGVERESSFEAEILETTECEIFMYDFSVDKFGPQIEAMNATMQARAHFHQFGVGGKDEIIDNNQFYTLETLMNQNGHDWIDILKIDTEGAEFKILPDVITHFGNGNLPFGQLLLEIHADQMENAYKVDDFAAWWEMLEDAGLRAFTSELNFPAIHWNPFPTAMEMNFLNTCLGREKCGTLLRDY